MKTHKENIQYIPTSSSERWQSRYIFSVQINSEQRNYLL